MLRTAWRALRSIPTQAVAQAPVRGLPGGACARPPFHQWGLPSPPGGVILPAVRGYAIQKPVQRSQEDDPPPSTLLKDYQNIPGIEKFDDVVRRLLSLEMASQKEKLKVKQEQLMKKIVANPEDTSSLEARIVALTVKIRNYEEHRQKHRKDKTHKCYLLMSIDQRNKMLKNLRKTNYSVFEKICKELGIEYTFPPAYHRKAHHRWATKKALCIRVFQEFGETDTMSLQASVLKTWQLQHWDLGDLIYHVRDNMEKPGDAIDKESCPAQSSLPATST